MSNIRVDVDYTIRDGLELKFRSPVDCSQITGLIVYYPGADGNTTSTVFALSDAHGNNVGNIDHLFAEDVVVKVILDVTKGMAFVQNADTNAYLEAQLASKAPAGYGLGEHIYCHSGDDVLEFFDEQLATMPNGTKKFIEFAGDYATTSGALFVGELCKRDNNYAYVIGYTYSDAMGLYRAKYNGVWNPWEFINPPMEIGKEYRTTERWNNRAVYTKLINCGANAASSYITIPADATYLVRHNSWVGPKMKSLPLGRYTDGSGYFAHTYVDANGRDIIFKADTNSDGMGTGAESWYVQLWYTKS